MRVTAISTADLIRLAGEINGLAPAVDDADRIERIRAFEALKAAIVAEQMAEAVRFATAQHAAAADDGVPAAMRSRGVTS